MAKKRKQQPNKMADAICKIASIITEEGLEFKELRKLSYEERAAANWILIYIQSWSKMVQSCMPEVGAEAEEKFRNSINPHIAGKQQNEAISYAMSRLLSLPDISEALSKKEE